MIDSPSSNPVRIAFLCVQNAGRSQMAYAFAEHERKTREISDRFEFVTGGTDPASTIHPEVVDVMAEVGIDLSGRRPRPITETEIDQSDLVIAMGCPAEAACPATWSMTHREWAIDDPHGQPPAIVRRIRDEIEHQVHALIDAREVTPPHVR